MRELAARFQIGVIATTHGLKGEVKVFPTTEDPERFLKTKRILLDTGREGVRELEVERARINGKYVTVKFKGLDRIEDVERFRGRELMVPREDAIDLDAGEYYTSDLIGMEVKDEDGKLLGHIVNVFGTGANDVYEMERADGKETILLPAIKDCILSVDIEGGVMKVHMMDGLM